MALAFSRLPLNILLLSALLCLLCASSSLGGGSASSYSDYLETEILKVSTGEFASSVKSTISVVEQVTSLVSKFANASAFADFRLSNAIADCLDLLDLSADELTLALSAASPDHQNPPPNRN